MTIKIGSRTSKLALKQVEIAMKSIRVSNFEIVNYFQNKEAIENRKKSIPAVEKIIAEELDQYEHSIERNNYVLPRIKEIDHHLSSITDHELDRIKNKVDREAFEVIEKLTGRIKKKVMAIHINRIENELEELRNEA